VTGRRVLLTAVLLTTAALLQVVVLQAIPFPGATPDLVLLVVVALALVQGSNEGAVVGFAGGLLLDVMPPSDSQVGRWALVLALVGWFAGRASDAAEESALVPVLVVALAAGGSVLAYAGIGYALGDLGVSGSAVVRVLPWAVLYDVVLSPFVVPGVMWLARRVEPGTTYARGYR
jgi:rod shape-determining protein MreD